jgi:hypothetical protein
MRVRHSEDRLLAFGLNIRMSPARAERDIPSGFRRGLAIEGKPKKDFQLPLLIRRSLVRA